jgi:preprotein translocase subunit SecA
MVQQAWPVIKEVFEKQGKVYENIVVPVSDGTKVYQILTNLEKAYQTDGHEVLRAFEKTANLASIDETWKEHLRELDDLKQSVQNATYEQKDPLLIYKFESFELFKTAVDRINKDIVSSLLKGNIPLKDPSQVQQAAGPRRLDTSNLQQTKSDAQSAYEGGGDNGEPAQRQPQKVEPVRTGRKIGRNAMVKVRYQNGNVVEAKYKKVEQDINSGACVLTS